MKQLSTHKAFFAHTTKLALELKQIQNAVQQQEQQLLERIDQLTQSVRQAAGKKQPAAVKDALNSYFDQTNRVLAAWHAKVASYDAGLSFRQKFGDSLLVYVYGKVKAGKSSLGNFIATGSIAPTSDELKQLAKELHEPKYFVEAVNDKFAAPAHSANGFAVGDVETTSCIQGFTVPGLTWVDSPGLHSINAENGDLASKYVEAADLIIYPMNADQPGRQTDFAELEGLLKAGKRILVLLTRSDEVDTDVDDEGNIVEKICMKAASKRQDQERYVQQELDALCQRLGIKGADTSVLSLSVAYAQSQHNSAQAMQESGVGALFAKLQHVLYSEGIELKKQVPQKNLQAFYQQLLAEQGELSLQKLSEPLLGAQNSLQQLVQDMEDLQVLASARAGSAVAAQIETIVERHAASRNVKAINDEIDAAMTQAIDVHYRAQLKEKYAQALQTLVNTVSDMGSAVDVEFSFEERYQDITYDVSGKTAAVGAGAGSVVGGIIGFMLGGPLGMGIGSAVGGGAGGLAGKHWSSTETKSILVGDNRDAIKAQLIKQSHAKVAALIASLHDEAVREIVAPMQQAVTQVLSYTTHFESYLQEQAHV